MADALKTLQDMLEPYGLKGLADQLFKLRETDVITDDMDTDTKLSFLTDTPEYKARFAVNDKLIKAGQPPKKPSEILLFERNLRDVMVNNQLAPELYDKPDDFEKLIIGAVSPAELQRRINQGYDDVRNADPEVVRQMKELYNVTEADLVSYFIDPVRTESKILRQAETAKISAQAKLQAGMQLTAQEAQQIEATGATEAAARKGFAEIRAQEQLYTPLLGEQGQISREEQIGAALGTSAAATQRIETRRRRRVAEFEVGGSFATGQTGITGLSTQ